MSVVLILTDEMADEVRMQITHLIKTMGIDLHETADNPTLLQLFLANLEKAMANANGTIQAFFDGNGPAGNRVGSYRIRPFMDIAEHISFKEEFVSTSNQAEYSAMIVLMQKLIELTTAGDIKPGDSIVIYGDSELVIRQMTGEYHCKEPVLRNLRFHACMLCDRLRELKVDTLFRHIPRESNNAELNLPN